MWKVFKRFNPGRKEYHKKCQACTLKWQALFNEAS